MIQSVLLGGYKKQGCHSSEKDVCRFIEDVYFANVLEIPLNRNLIGLVLLFVGFYLAMTKGMKPK